MLKSMRKHAKFFYVLFVIVILSFIFWGVGTVDKNNTVAVAEIGNEKVTIEEYWRAYEKVREIYRDLYKGRFTEEIEKKMKLKETLLDNLIEDRVLLISAKELGLSVSDKELQEAITTDQRFVRDGIFRKEIYFRTLDLNRLTPDMFEASLRRQILLSKIRNLVGSAVESPSPDLKGLSGDDKKADELRQSILAGKRNLAIRSYVDGVKQRMKVKINTNLIS